MSLGTPEKVQKLQETLHAKAKGPPKFRFYALYDKVCTERMCYGSPIGGASSIEGQRG